MVYLGRMSTSLRSVPERTETLNEAVARRLRGAFGEQRVSASTIAREIGMTQQALSRRMVGKTPMTLGELEAVCQAATIDLAWVITGSGNTKPSGPEGPDGGDAVRHQGLEPRTR